MDSSTLKNNIKVKYFEMHCSITYFHNEILKVSLQVTNWFCLLAPGLFAFLSWKILQFGKNMTFINFLYLTIFTSNSVTVLFHVHFFFRVGNANLLENQGNDSDIHQLCANYISSWLTNIIINTVPWVVVIFCRFIYARYAHGLLLDGGKLFRKLVGVTMLFFCLQLIFMWPVQYEMGAKKYSKIIKGRICTKSPIPEFLGDQADAEFSVRPKLITITITLICVFFTLYWTKAAKKERKRYKIPTLNKNVMNIDDNMMVVWLVGINSIVEQLFNILLEYFYAEMGVDRIFKIWWTYQLVMFIQLYLILPGVLIWNAYKKSTDFNGFKANPFPGQEKPKNIELVPRREEFNQYVSKYKKYSETPLKQIFMNIHTGKWTSIEQEMSSSTSGQRPSIFARQPPIELPNNDPQEKIEQRPIAILENGFLYQLNARPTTSSTGPPINPHALFVDIESQAVSTSEKWAATRITDHQSESEETPGRGTTVTLHTAPQKLKSKIFLLPTIDIE